MSDEKSQNSVEERYGEHEATPADDVYSIGGERLAMRMGEWVSLDEQ